MAELMLRAVYVGLNAGVKGAGRLEAELEKIFPTDTPSVDLSVSYHDDVTTAGTDTLALIFNLIYHRSGHDESLMSLHIDGVDEIDALRRYCEMVLEHHASTLSKATASERLR